MKEIVAKLREICEEYNQAKDEIEPELFYDFYVNPEIHARFIVGPVEASDGISLLLAERIAERHGVILGSYDFARGKWSEAADCRPVFYLDLKDVSSCQNSKEQLLKAAKELQNASNKLVADAIPT